MRIAVIGGDARYGYLAARLASEGHEIVDITHEPELALVGDRESAARAPASARRVWCGPGAAPPGWASLSDDETYLCQNAYLTAEGAVSAAMQSLDVAIEALPCLIIGWGRIGAALSGLLAVMGARVLVASRREGARREIEGYGAHYIGLGDISGVLPSYRAIFNTAPATVLSGDALALIGKSALLIDLASPPYGFNLDAARALGLNARRENGLPGRYCPATAAEVMLSALRRGGAL